MQECAVPVPKVIIDKHNEILMKVHIGGIFEAIMPILEGQITPKINTHGEIYKGGDPPQIKLACVQQSHTSNTQLSRMIVKKGIFIIMNLINLIPTVRHFHFIPK